MQMNKDVTAESNCIFCQQYKTKKQNIIYQNDFFFSFFDCYPVTPGHALIIPKQHIVSLFDLDEHQWMLLKEAVWSVKKIIEQTDFKQVYRQDTIFDERQEKFYDAIKPLIGKKIAGYNVGNNDGAAAGRTVHHLHVHLIPRYVGDVPDPVGGVRNIIPEMGNYKK